MESRTRSGKRGPGEAFSAPTEKKQKLTVPEDENSPLTTPVIDSDTASEDVNTTGVDRKGKGKATDVDLAITPVSSVETHSNVEGVASTTPDLVEELPKLGVQLISNKISIPGHKTASHCDNDIDPSSYEVTLMQHEGIINPGYITDKAMTRLAKAVSLSSKEACKYPLPIAIRGEWGSLHSESAKYLCSNGVPICGTVVGQVTKTYFFNIDGKPVSRVNIGIKPLRSVDRVAYNDLMNLKSQPADTNGKREVIYAARFQTQFQRGETNQVCKTFDRVWDARTLYGPKGTVMKNLNPAFIAVNDVVMLEFAINRYKPRTDDHKNSGKVWSKWAVALELQDVILFCESPPSDEAGVQHKNLNKDGVQMEEECF